jgi:hypothetical protein
MARFFSPWKADHWRGSDSPCACQSLEPDCRFTALHALPCTILPDDDGSQWTLIMSEIVTQIFTGSPINGDMNNPPIPDPSRKICILHYLCLTIENA